MFFSGMLFFDTCFVCHNSRTSIGFTVIRCAKTSRKMRKPSVYSSYFCLNLRLKSDDDRSAAHYRMVRNRIDHPIYNLIYSRLQTRIDAWKPFIMCLFIWNMSCFKQLNNSFKTKRIIEIKWFFFSLHI